MKEDKIAKEDKVFIELNSSMKNAPNDIVIQEAGCHAILENIVSGGELKLKKDIFLKDDGVIVVVMDALRGHPKATNLQIIAFSLLDKLGRLDNDFAAAIYKGQGLWLIIEKAYLNSVETPEMRRASGSFLAMINTHLDYVHGPTDPRSRPQGIRYSPSK
jgi:hypothetical protein